MSDRAGDDAWPTNEESIRELSASLRKMALELVSEVSAADDVVQDTWLALLETQRKNVGHAGRWMRSVLRNTVSRRERRSTLQRDWEAAAARSEAESDEQVLEWRSTAHMLIDAVANLEDPYRRVLRARYFQERSVGEIATEMGVPDNTVKTWTRRGLDRLRETLDRESGGDRRVWALALAPFTGQQRSTPQAPAAAWGVQILVGAAVATLLGAAAWLFLGGESTSEADQVARAPLELREQPEPSLVRGRPADAVRAPVTPVSSAEGVALAPDAPLATLRDLRVEVRDGRGQPVERATVVARGELRVELTRSVTGPEGVTTLQVDVTRVASVAGFDSPHPLVQIDASAPGYAPSDTHHVPLASTDDNVVVISLRGKASRFAGRLIDEDGEPVAGARLRAVRPANSPRVLDGGVITFPSSEEVLSDKTGRFLFEGLDAHARELRVYAAGYVSRRIPVDPLRAQAMTAEDEATWVLERGAVAFGKLTHADGTSAAGALLVLIHLPTGPGGSIPARADANGVFELFGIPPEACVVQAISARDPNWSANIVIHGGREPETEWNATLEARDPVRIRAIDSRGEPAPDLLVTLTTQIEGLAWKSLESTDEDGVVTFPYVPDALFEANFYGKDSLQQGLVAQRVPGLRPSSVEHVVHLEPELRDEPGTLRVTVRVGAAEPPPGAGLHALSLETNEQFVAQLGPGQVDGGRIDLPGLPAGAFVVHVLVPGRGLIPLGTHHVLPGQRVELAPVTLPSLVPVRIPPRPDGEAAMIELVGVLESPEVTQNIPILLVDRAEGAQLALFPGQYALRSTEDAGSSWSPFTLLAGVPLEWNPPTRAGDD